MTDPKTKAEELYNKYVNYTNVAKEMALIDVEIIKNTINPDGTTDMWVLWTYWSDVENAINELP